jgi:hypothetical protein
MKQLVAAALAFSVALPAWPQIRPPPPPPEEDEPQPPRQVPVEDVGYFGSCFGVPRVGSGPFGISGEVVIPLSGSGSGESAPSVPISSGSGNEKAWLVAAVLAAMAAPVVLYAVDKPAPRLVLQRFACPTFTLDLLGGADNGPAALGTGSFGFVSTRFGFGVGHVAADFQYDGAPRAISAFATHFLVRATPRDHVEGGLAIGYRRSVLGDRIESGLEIGLPHRYTLWRDGLRTLGLELRPMLLVGTSIEPSLEAAFLFPLAPVLHLRAGGRVYTFDGNLLWGLSAGLGLTL